MNWRNLHQLLTWKAPEAPGPVAEPPPVSRGGYHPLQVYLQKRFAGRVVLTFSEIEDLIGFTLPTQARLDKSWWGASDSPARDSPHRSAWTTANREAVVNLVAGNVVFERRD